MPESDQSRHFDPDTPFALWPRRALRAQWQAWDVDQQAEALTRCDRDDLEALLSALDPVDRYQYVLTHVDDPELWSQETTLLFLLPYWRDAGERLRIGTRYCAVTGQRSSYKLDKALDALSAEYTLPPDPTAGFVLDTFLTTLATEPDVAARFAQVMDHDLELFGLPGKQWALLLSRLDSLLKPADCRELVKLRKSHKKQLGKAKAQERGALMDVRDLPLGEYTNVLAFLQDNREVVRYCYPWKSWLVWTGTHWHRDDTGAVDQLAKTTVKRLAGTLVDREDQDASAFLMHIKRSLTVAALDGMLRSVRNEPGIPILPNALDQDPWLLNCLNGTLDLQTGTLRPHAQEDYISKCLPTPYAPEATCPTWHAFLWRVMGGSQGDDTPDMSTGELEARAVQDATAREMMDYLQQVLGYTLTGVTREQCLFLCEGPTKTGKSTFLTTLRHLLGPYAQQADMESFMHKDRPEVRNDLADLAGSRFVCALEGQEGKRLAEALVKQMTGGTDELKARFLFQNYFTFRPQFKIFLGTNFLPRAQQHDDALWDRMKRIPFRVQIPVNDRDYDLEDTLQTELPGILAWAVQGCLAWLKAKRLMQPETVTAATAAYRDSMDPLAPFLDECCRVGDQETVKTKATRLASAYQSWCKRTNETPMDNRRFIANLEQKGFVRKHGAGNNYFWFGVDLAVANDDPYS